LLNAYKEHEEYEREIREIKAKKKEEKKRRAREDLKGKIKERLKANEEAEQEEK